MPETAKKPSNRIIKSGLSLLTARYAQPFLSFALFAIAARFLPLTEIGAYIILINMLFIFQASANLGLVPLLTREISIALSDTDGWFLVMIVMALPASLLAWILFYLSTIALSYTPEIVTGSLILGATLPLSVGIQTAEAVFLAHGRHWALCVPSLTECVFRLVLSAALLVSGYGLNALFWAYAASRLLGFIVMLAYFLNTISRNNLKWDAKKFRILFNGIPTFGLMFVAAIVFFRMDVIIISRVLGEEAAGLYGAAHRFVALTFLLPESIVATLFPIISRLIHNSRSEATELVRTMLRLLLGLELPLVLCMAAISGWLIPFLFGDKFLAAGVLAPILALVLLPHTINGLFGFLLQADRKERVALVLVLSGLLIHFFLIIGFVKCLGINGAAWGLLLSTLILGFLHMVIVDHYTMELNMGRMLLPVFLGIAFGWWVMNQIPGDWLIVRLILGAATALICLFTTGTFNKVWLQQAWATIRDARV